MTKKTERKIIPSELRDSAQKVWLAGLGALAVAEEEGGKLFNTLVKKGESFEKRGKKQLRKVQEEIEDRVGGVKDKAGSTLDRLSSSFDERVADALKRLGVPTRIEIQKLTKRVEQLTHKVDELRPRARTAKTKKSA